MSFNTKKYNPKFPKRPSLVCPNFRQLGCPEFQHKSRNLMSKIGTLKCPDFGTVWNRDVPISDIHCNTFCSGDHGGDSKEELSAALYMYSKKNNYKGFSETTSVSQVNFEQSLQ